MSNPLYADLDGLEKAKFKGCGFIAQPDPAAPGQWTIWTDSGLKALKFNVGTPASPDIRLITPGLGYNKVTTDIVADTLTEIPAGGGIQTIFGVMVKDASNNIITQGVEMNIKSGEPGTLELISNTAFTDLDLFFTGTTFVFA
jgi:hypothetical protein